VVEVIPRQVLLIGQEADLVDVDGMAGGIVQDEVGTERAHVQSGDVRVGAVVDELMLDEEQVVLALDDLSAGGSAGDQAAVDIFPEGVPADLVRLVREPQHVIALEALQAHLEPTVAVIGG